MSVAKKCGYIYGIYHWIILRSSYRKFAWVGSDHWIPFKRSNQLSYQAMSSTRTQTQLCTVAPMSSCVQCHISFRQFSSSVATFIFIKIFVEVFTWVYWYERIYMVFTTEGFFRSKYRKLVWVGFVIGNTYEAILNILEELQCSETK